MKFMVQWPLAVLSMCVVAATATPMTFKQDDFMYTYERAEVISSNPDYVSNPVIKNFKYNRTQTFSNMSITFKANINADTKIQIQAYKFMSNEYRHFPILFSYNFCEGVLKDDFGMGGLFACGNLTKRCPFTKGNYFICNFAPNGEKFPPFIPEGSYMVDVKWFVGPTEMLFVQGYGKVKPKYSWEMN